jgi:hypothetical protein
MLPANTLAAISNVVALNLEPQTTMAVLGAVLAPLLQSSQAEVPHKAARTQRQPRRKQKKPKRRRVKANVESTDGPRERARAALKANPGASLTAIAKIAGCSRGTAVAARRGLATEARKLRPSEPSPRLKRARDQLRAGPRPISDVEEAAQKAKIDPQVLERARAQLRITTSRSSAANGPHALQWALPSGGDEVLGAKPPARQT